MQVTCPAEAGFQHRRGGFTMRHILDSAVARRNFIASLGGAAAVALMSHEAKADALEGALMAGVSQNAKESQSCSPGTGHYPTVAELDEEIPTRSYRRGTGSLFLNTEGGKVEQLAKMPARPTLWDFYELRFMKSRNHCFQSANKALHAGVDEEIVLACLIHDTVQELVHVD